MLPEARGRCYHCLEPELISSVSSGDTISGRIGTRMCSMKQAVQPAALVLAAVGFAFGSTPAMAQPAAPGLQITYVEPTNPAHRPIYERLKQRKVLEQYQEFMSPLKLPRSLQVVLQGCNGTVNAWFDGNARITLCYEYIDLIEKVAAKGDAPPGFKREDAVVGPFVQV